MRLNIQQAIRALILLAFSGFIFKLHFTGEITKFINPKYESLSQIASVVFLILFFIQITRIWTVKEENHHHCHNDDHCCTHDHGDSTFSNKKLISYLVIVFPLITGFLLPAKVLDASIADKKGAMLTLSNQKQGTAEDDNNERNNPVDQNTVDNEYDGPVNDTHTDPIGIENQKEISKKEFDQLIKTLEQSSTIGMDDFVYAAYYDEISRDINKYKGREIELKGFVYKEDGLAQDQLVISRFLITHCIADASIIGFLSEFAEAPSLTEDTWIEAKGVLNVTSYNGTELPVIKITSWKKINEPKEPYLYPISVRLI